MVNEQFSWGKTICTAVVTGLLAGGAFAVLQPNPQNVDQAALKKVVEDAVKAESAKSVAALNTAVSEFQTANAKVVSAADKILEEDLWESEAEVLATDELENRDYRELRKELVDSLSAINDSNLVLNNVDYDEIEDFEVTVKDKETTIDDLDDKDATVIFKLKVEYENELGNNVNKYVTALVTIKDGEVENVEYSLT